jgi:hypothetical protein
MPKDRSQNIEIKIEFLFSYDYFLPTLCAMRYALCVCNNGLRTTNN